MCLVWCYFGGGDDMSMTSAAEKMDRNKIWFIDDGVIIYLFRRIQAKGHCGTKGVQRWMQGSPAVSSLDDCSDVLPETGVGHGASLALETETLTSPGLTGRDVSNAILPAWIGQTLYAILCKPSVL